MDKREQMMIGFEAYVEVLNEKLKETDDKMEKAALVQKFLELLQKDFFHPLDYWTHYKGGVYQFLTLAINEETLHPVVVYQNLRHGTLWIRKLSNFLEQVTLPDGTQVNRFELGAP